MKNQQNRILKQYRVSELLTIQIEAHEVTRYQGRGKPKADGSSAKVVETYFQLSFERNQEAIAERERLLGWRIYVTNASVAQLPRHQAIAYYRDQWQLERGYHRLKRGAIPAVPIFLQHEHRIVGLMFLLTLALRVLTLVEFRVRRELLRQQDSLAGLYAGNPKRKTHRPSAELLLGAFDGITLYCLADRSLHLTELNFIQQRILELLHIPKLVYWIPHDRCIPATAA